MSPDHLETAIFRTLAYFSFSQYPLTVFEVWKWLLDAKEKYSLAQVREHLCTSVWLKERTREINGYYGLGDTEAWVNERERRYVDAQRKERRARRWGRWLAALPNVRAVGICNSLAWHATTPKSDIDFFIITKKQRVWSIRFFGLVPLALLRLRPGERHEDPVCLSFFVDETELNMKQFRLGDDDWYLAYWCASVAFVAGDEQILESWRRQNDWVKKVLPNAWFVRRVPTYRLRHVMKLPFLRVPESLARSVQEWRMPERLRKLRNVDTRVVLNDRILKFHDTDRRADMTAYVRLLMQKEGL